MKNLNVIYRHDRFYDAVSGKRIILEEGKRYALLGDDANFLDDDGINQRPKNLLQSKEILARIEKDPKVKSFKRLLDKGSYLCFEHGHRKRKNSDEDQRRHFFTVELLEDLYLYSNKEKLEGASLYQCNCLTNHVEPALDFFEPIYGGSLNNLFEKVSMFYYSNLRSSAVNAFNEFHVYDPFNNEKGMSLGDLRAALISKFSAQ